MATNEEKLETMVADFEKAYPAGGKNLREILKDTPELKQRFIDAIDKGALDKIEAVSIADRNDGVAGSYSPSTNTIAVPMDYLDIADKEKVAGNFVRSTLGHELGHAINKVDIEASNKKFNDEVEKIAKGPSPHEYTQALYDINKRDRTREAEDEIAGINILAAHVMRKNPKATLEDLYLASPDDMQNYVDVTGTAPDKLIYAQKEGITFDENLKIQPTKENVEAVGKHFYDGNNYPKDYGQYNLDTIKSAEAMAQQDAKKMDPTAKAPEIKVNLSALGLNSDPSMSNGVSLPAGFTDSSSPPPKPVVAPASAPTTDSAAAMYLQSLAGLKKLGPESGIDGSQALDTAARAMAVKANGDGLRQISSVVESTHREGFIAIQGEQRSEHAIVSYLTKAEAMQRPSEQEMAKLPIDSQSVKVAMIEQPQISGPKPS